MKANDVKEAWGTTFAKMKAPTIALFAAVALVSIFRGSGVNDAGMDSMPLALAKTLAVLTGEAWPALASYVGASAPSSPAPTPCPTCSSRSSSGIWPHS